MPAAIVVGAGVLGAAVADALIARGWAVTIVEQYAPANARGSSGDHTRLLRLGHGEPVEEHDRHYIASAERGIAGWKALQEQSGERLLEPTGLVWLATREGGVEERAAAGLTRAGKPHERLTPEEAAALFPSMAVEDLRFALYEPDALVIRAKAAAEALLARAVRGGARLLTDRAHPAGPGAVALADGRLAADCVVWACGAWLGALFPREAPVRPSWQDVLYWQAPPSWRGAPAWFDEAVALYGLPDVDGSGHKAVSHAPGRTFDPERDGRVPDAAAIARVGAYLARRFPALAGCGLLTSRVMPYEMTPDGHFVAGPAELAGHWLLGGGSGHAFKHAPALGEHLAGLVEGTEEVVELWRPGPRLMAAGVGDRR